MKQVSFTNAETQTYTPPPLPNIYSLLKGLNVTNITAGETHLARIQDSRNYATLSTWLYTDVNNKPHTLSVTTHNVWLIIFPALKQRFNVITMMLVCVIKPTDAPHYLQPVT